MLLQRFRIHVGVVQPLSLTLLAPAVTELSIAHEQQHQTELNNSSTEQQQQQCNTHMISNDSSITHTFSCVGLEAHCTGVTQESLVTGCCSVQGQM
jgi:hypothetical protein